MANKLVVICVLLFLVALTVLIVSAATTLVAPIADSGGGGTIAFNCSTTNISAINATVLYAYDANKTFGHLITLANSTYLYNVTTIGNDAEGQITFNTSFLDISGLESSVTYNFSCMVWINGSATDGVFTENATARTGIIIDNTNPTPALTYPATTKNFSNSTIIFNTTIFDNYNVTNATLWGNWSTGWHGNLTIGPASNNTVSTFNIPAINLSDGHYVWNVYACDNRTNCAFASSNSTITVDTTAPVITHSCTATSVTEGDTLTCTCTATDVTSLISSKTYTTATPSTGSRGTYTTTCTASDYVSNSASSILTYIVYPVSNRGTSTSTGTTTTWTSTETISKETFEQGVTRQIQEKKKLQVQVEEENHYIGVVALTTTSATIEIASATPEQITMEIGEEGKFEVTDDDYYDIYVKLNSIESSKADITIRAIHELMPEEPELSPEDNETAGDEGTPTSTPSSKNIWIYILIIVVVLVIVGVIVLKKKPSVK